MSAIRESQRITTDVRPVKRPPIVRALDAVPRRRWSARDDSQRSRDRRSGARARRSTERPSRQSGWMGDSQACGAEHVVHKCESAARGQTSVPC